MAGFNTGLPSRPWRGPDGRLPVWPSGWLAAGVRRASLPAAVNRGTAARVCCTERRRQQRCEGDGAMAGIEENVATVRRGYEYFNSGNIEGLASIFAEDAVWHAAGRNRFAGEKRGRDAAFAYFGQIAEATGGTFHTEPH